MTLSRQIAGIIYGLYRLVRKDADGIEYMDTSAKGAVRSFFAAVLVFPVYLVQTKYFYEQQTMPPPVANYIFLQVITYVIGWTLWPVIVHYLLKTIEAQENFFRYVVSYNWLRLVENFILVPIIVLSSVIKGDGLIILCGFAVIFAFVFYEWFIAKAALKVSSGAAAGIVFLNIIIHMLLNDLNMVMMGGS